MAATDMLTGARGALRLMQTAVAAVAACAAAAFVFSVAATLIVGGFFASGCSFTERVVDKKLLSTPEMRFSYLDPDRDIQDITGSLVGGGGAGGGSC
jgi:hypothetical protein